MFMWPILSWFYSFVLYVIYHHTSTCSCGQSWHGSIPLSLMTFTIIHLHVPGANLVMVLFLCPLCHIPSYIYMFLWPILAWFYSFVLKDIYHHTSTCSCSQSCHGSISFRLLQFRFLFSGSACQMSFVEAPVCCSYTCQWMLRLSGPPANCTLNRCCSTLEALMVLFMWFESHLYDQFLVFNPWSAEIRSYKPWRPKSFFQFELMMNILVSPFWLIWITMLWV